MEPQIQQTNQPMSADMAAASLAFATSLLEKTIPRQEAPQEPQEAPGGEETPEMGDSAPMDTEALKAEITADVLKQIKEEKSSDTETADDKDDLKDEIRGMIKSEMNNLAKTIKDALK